jgi:triacylglycerol lipase
VRIASAAAVLVLASCAANRPTAIVDVQSQVPAAIEAQLLQIGRVVAPPQTAALYAPLAQKEPYADVKVTRDVAYGPDARHRLDVFEPAAGASGRPVLVFVHGGAFIGGNKRTGDSPFYDNVMLWAVASGMVGVNATYRLAPQYQWPEAQRDLARVVQWVRQGVASHGGNPARIYLMGHSAGAAHVAQYVGHPELQAVPGGGIAGAIMVSGLFDTTTAEPNPPLQAYFGTDRSQYAPRSALPGMVASGLPMMLAHAELDPPDFHQQAEQAHSALCAARRCPDSYRLLGHTHMSEVYSINTPDRGLVDAIRAFVARQQ